MSQRAPEEGFQVLQVQPREWRRLRGIRLRALREDPGAFGSNLEREQGFAEADWRRRASRRADGGTWTARTAEGWVGLVGGLLEADRRVQLVSMWVAPEWRGTAVAAALVVAVRAWREARGGGELYLRVAADDLRARAFYSKAGFRETGPAEAGQGGRERRLLEMRLEDPGSAG